MIRSQFLKNSISVNPNYARDTCTSWNTNLTRENEKYDYLFEVKGIFGILSRFEKE